MGEWSQESGRSRQTLAGDGVLEDGTGAAVPAGAEGVAVVERRGAVQAVERDTAAALELANLDQGVDVGARNVHARGAGSLPVTVWYPSVGEERRPARSPRTWALEWCVRLDVVVRVGAPTGTSTPTGRWGREPRGLTGRRPRIML